MKRKLYVVFLLMFLLIGALAINVSAYSFTTSMTPNRTKVSDATEVVITVKVSNLDVGENGINSFEASLNYDTDVFETVNESSIEGLNGWIEAFSSGEAKISMKKNAFVNADEEVFQITLKTKSGVEEGKKGTVSLSNIKATNSAEEITSSNISTTITIGSQTTTPGESDSNGTGNNGNSGSIQIVPRNNTTNNSSNNSSNQVNNVANNTENTNSSNNVTNDTVPYTGSEGNSMTKIIFGVIIVALVAYIKFERLRDVK